MWPGNSLDLISSKRHELKPWLKLHGEFSTAFGEDREELKDEQ